MAGRRKPSVLEGCSTPWCWRTAKRGFPFCERCWGYLTDDERSGAWVACRAPLWPTGRASAWPVGSFHCADIEWQTTPSGWMFAGGLTPGTVLAEFEQRTTLAAMAQLCWIRDMSRTSQGRALLAKKGIEPQEIPT